MSLLHACKSGSATQLNGDLTEPFAAVGYANSSANTEISKLGKAWGERILMLFVSRRQEIVSWSNCILAPELSVQALNGKLTTSLVLEHFFRRLYCFSLSGVTA